MASQFSEVVDGLVAGVLSNVTDKDQATKKTIVNEALKDMQKNRIESSIELTLTVQKAYADATNPNVQKALDKILERITALNES